MPTIRASSAHAAGRITALRIGKDKETKGRCLQSLSRKLIVDVSSIGLNGLVSMMVLSRSSASG